MTRAERIALAEHVRTACLEVALREHEDAGMRGLCAEGRWEAAIDAVRNVDLTVLVRSFDAHEAEAS